MAGAAVAAAAAAIVLLIVGPGGHSRDRAAQPLQSATLAPGAPRRELLTAADYLGISTAQLRRKMLSGSTPASVAEATSGKSVEGMIQALLASRSAQTKEAVAKGRLSKKAAAKRLARLRRRASAFVNRPGSGGLISLSVTSRYLGLAPAKILARERAGHSPAQIANATHRRSAAGLISALLSARSAQLRAAAAAGTLDRAREQALLATLRQRVSTAVHG